MLGQFLAAWLGRRMESRRILAIGMSVAAACQHRARLPGRRAGRERVPVDLRHHGHLRVRAGDRLAAQRRAVRQLDAQGRARNAVRGLGHLLPVRRDLRQGTRGLPARLARARLVVLRLEPRAARLHRLLRAARARAAGIGGADAARRGRARSQSRHSQEGRHVPRDAAAAARLHRLRGRDGPHLLRLQVPALRARFLVRADPRRALRHVRLVRRLLLDRFRLGRASSACSSPATGRTAFPARAARR